MNAVTPVHINILILRDTLASFPPEHRQNGAQASFYLGTSILKHYFGQDWLYHHLTPNPAKPGFLNIDESSPSAMDLSGLRVIDLAEVIYNLQSIEGFHDCIAKMRNGDIEGTFAELDLGRMLYLNLVPFRFVRAQGVKSSDYDVEVKYPDGLTACAEAKCSIQSTSLSEETIKNKLDAARKQLPADRPGIVFVKMPPRWMSEAGFAEMTIGTARRFLRGTRRVVSVKFYTSPNTIGGGYLKQEHAYKEISNPNADFGESRNWDLFHKWDLAPEANGMPPHWQRVLFFPDGKPW